MLVPVKWLRPVVERWVAGFDTPEEAYDALATASGLTVDAWRKRLYQNGRWWERDQISDTAVDEFLTAADLPHLWPVADAGPRKTCTQCRSALPFNAFPHDHRKRDGRHSWCRACKSADTKRRRDENIERERAADRERYRVRGPRSSSSARPRTAPRRYPRRHHAKLTSEHVAAAYRLYQAGLSLLDVGELIWQRFGFPNPTAARNALNIAFHKDGLPLRSKPESVRLAKARRRELLARAA